MRTLFLGGAILCAGLCGGPVWAAPSFCTGTVTTVASGDFVAGSNLVNTATGASNGNCVLAADKFFGGFSVGGAITAGGTTGWLFTMGSGPADVTLGFQGLVGSSSSGFVNYSVEVNPANSNGALIDDLQKDFTFNSLGTGSTATLSGTVTPTPTSFAFGGDPAFPGQFHCTRTLTTATCPQEGLFSPLTADLVVDETITTGPNTNVTALTDTVSQAIPGVPEPRTVTMLLTALLGMMLSTRWQRS